MVSVKSGHVFERSLIEKYLKEYGKCPITGELLTQDDLVPVKSGKSLKPRHAPSTSIPGLIGLFQNVRPPLNLKHTRCCTGGASRCRRACSATSRCHLELSDAKLVHVFPMSEVRSTGDKMSCALPLVPDTRSWVLALRGGRRSPCEPIPLLNVLAGINRSWTHSGISCVRCHVLVAHAASREQQAARRLVAMGQPESI